MRNEKYHILFVCTGNSCRSPLAAGVLKKSLPKRLANRVRIGSAGTAAFDGSHVTENAITAAKELGVDLSRHRSRKVKKNLVKDVDLIFALATDHKEFLETTFPEVRDNVFLLKTFDRDKKKIIPKSIPDPIGKDLDYYRKIYAEIDQEIKRIMPRVIMLIEERLNDYGHSKEE